MAAPSGRKPDAKAASGKTAAADKKSGKTGAVAGKAPSGKAPAAKAPSGKTPAAKTTSARKIAPVSGGGSRPSGPVWVTCRECSEEWTVDLDKAQRADTLTCPVCEHRAEPPSDDILHQIALYKGIEAGNLRMALVSFFVGIGAAVAWTFLSLDPEKAAQPAMFGGPIAVAVLGLVGALFFTSKYENSKWETYF